MGYATPAQKGTDVQSDTPLVPTDWSTTSPACLPRVPVPTGPIVSCLPTTYLSTTCVPTTYLSVNLSHSHLFVHLLPSPPTYPDYPPACLSPWSPTHLSPSPYPPSRPVRRPTVLIVGCGRVGDRESFWTLVGRRRQCPLWGSTRRQGETGPNYSSTYPDP